MTRAAMPANRFAILMMALAMSALAANDAAMKAAGAVLPPGQIIGVRALMLLALLFVGTRLTGGAVALRHLAERWVLLRGLSDVCATYLFVTSLTLVPIALATTLVFVSPVILTALSGPLFGERVGLWRWGRWCPVFSAWCWSRPPARAAGGPN